MVASLFVRKLLQLFTRSSSRAYQKSSLCWGNSLVFSSYKRVEIVKGVRGDLRRRD